MSQNKKSKKDNRSASKDALTSKPAQEIVAGFDQMDLNQAVFRASQDVGYETATPIQAQAIPLLIQGKDIIGQAKTGTGKTAAFAMPLLSKIDLKNKRPQVLVLTPTRELAIQVAQSFKTYGKHMKGLNVLSVYGGQSYGVQLNQLKRGVHVVVGTPGRLMDHMRRKTVTFADLFCQVLDEADEMLHMGFIDDVEWIMDRTPKEAQTALFSATMPGPIRKIARKYLNQPEQITVKSKSCDVATIDQKFWMVKGAKKAIALERILSAATFDGVIVFVKTKNSTMDVAKMLDAKGFNAEALNGDMAQAARERTITRLKSGRIDILVATDVAARGLDVDRISHVINYDMPSKVDPYVHRIGRTGRAGRTGEAILFVNRNERWMLKMLEKATKQKIKEINLPSNKQINQKRVTDFEKAITQTIESTDLGFYEEMIQAYAEENEMPLSKVAAALAKLHHGPRPFFLAEQKTTKKETPAKTRETRKKPSQKPSQKSNQKNKPSKRQESPTASVEKPKQKVDAPKPVEKGMERYRIEVGRCHGVKTRNIVGAISNEAGLKSKYIANVCINHDHSLVDLPFGMPKNVFKVLQKTWVMSQKMSISRCA